MTAAEIKIEDLFEKDIRRDVNGVIKVDQEVTIQVAFEYYNFSSFRGKTA